MTGASKVVHRRMSNARPLHSARTARNAASPEGKPAGRRGTERGPKDAARGTVNVRRGNSVRGMANAALLVPMPRRKVRGPTEARARRPVDLAMVNHPEKATVRAANVPPPMLHGPMASRGVLIPKAKPRLNPRTRHLRNPRRRCRDFCAADVSF